MKRTLHTLLFLMIATLSLAQGFKVRECTEDEIPMSARGDYFKTAERYLHIYYQMLLVSVGNAENRQAVIDNVMAKRTGNTLKMEYLLQPERRLSYVSPSQYYIRFEKEFGEMADEMEFEVDNVEPGKIMMNSLVSCFLPVDYDLSLMYRDKLLYKRRCRMTFLFQKVMVSSIAKTMQVELLKEIIPYTPPQNSLTIDQLYARAVEWYDQGLKDKCMPVFKQLAEKGHTDAQWHYAMCLTKPSQYAEAIRWLERAVAKNHAKALNTLGWHYTNGAGVEKNHEKAFELYSRSAEMGWKTAAYNMGQSYDYGWGVPRSVEKAVAWYEKAISLGYNNGYARLADIYYEDQEKYKHWLFKGHENKDIDCTYHLAKSYAQGIHKFEKDEEKAIDYYHQVVYYMEKLSPEERNEEFFQQVKQELMELQKSYLVKVSTILKTLREDSSNPYMQAALRYQKNDKDRKKYDKALALSRTNRTKDIEKGQSVMQELASKGMPEALTFVAGSYERGNQFLEAYRRYAAAAVQQYPEAFAGLGDCYYYGKHVERDHMKAVSLYKEASRWQVYRYELGYCFHFGIGTEKNQKMAAECFQKMAEKGHAEAQAMLGTYYTYGIHFPKDMTQGALWLKKAANGGSVRGMYEWGLFLYYGKSGKKEVSAGLDWFLKAANADHSDAMVELGAHNHSAKRYTEALRWFERSAERGNHQALNWLGYLYKRGEGVPQSVDKAMQYYTKSAEYGNAYSMSEVAYWHYQQNTPEDWKKAFMWWEKAAMKNNTNAQYNLAVCYEDGYGVAKCLSKAIEWYAKAASAKHERSLEAISRLKKQFAVSGPLKKPVKEGQVSGVVYVEDGFVSDAFVYVKDSNIVTLTDKEGRFYLSGVDASSAISAVCPEYCYATIYIQSQDHQGRKKEYAIAGLHNRGL